MTKTCPKCRLELDVSMFGLDNNRQDKLNTYCRPCIKEKYLENKEYHARRSKKYYQQNKESMLESAWKRHLRRKYGLEYEDFLSMVKGQGNACKICHQQFGELRSRKVHVDHDHKTGKVRGILCKFCNDQLIRILEHPLKEAGEKYLQNNS